MVKSNKTYLLVKRLIFSRLFFEDEMLICIIKMYGAFC